jgi:putative glutamine amidotransferase
VSARPLIAVVAYHLAPGRVPRWPQGGYGVPAPYLEALRRAGARTAIISPGESGVPQELLEPFDGLLLVGGGDVDPARYGGTSDAHVYGVEPDRDDLEMDLVRATEALSLPTLCICRGMQIMNTAFGGSLHPHLPDLEGTIEHGVPVADTRTLHEVRTAPGSRLRTVTGGDVLSCSSHHHQGVDRLGDGLLATGWSSDGLVEAVERDPGGPGRDTWMVGVQWHPEDTATADPSQQALFDGFVLAANAHMSTKGRMPAP